MLAVLRAWASLLGPDIACISLDNARELARRRAAGVDIGQSWSTGVLRRAIPDLAWGLLLGPPYIALLGRERLLSAPAYRVEAWGEGQVFVQLSADPLDLEREPDAVAAVRERVLDHLGREHFLRPGLSRYCAPTFSFGDRGQVVPRADPEVVCAQLLRLLESDAAAALNVGNMERPVIWTVDHEDHAERVEFVLDPAPVGREQVLAEVERRVRARALLGSSAYGIARVETDGVVSINITHESGYATTAALKYGRPLAVGA